MPKPSYFAVLVTILSTLFAAAPPNAVTAQERPVAPGKAEFFLGVDANYSLEMESAGARWKWVGQSQELFSGIARQGARWLRVRLWTGEAGNNGRQYATRVVERAVRAGLEPYLVLFLSENWADLEKQPAPRQWADLPLEQRARAIREYASRTVTHFRRHGLNSHLYEVGNEIDYGLCGVYPAEGEGKDPASLRRRVWPEAAKLILACQQGVKQADPQAKFMLHIAHWWDPEFCVAFFQTMLAAGVQVDYAGLSYFPSSNIGGSLRLEQFGAVVETLGAAINRPVIVAETGYPSTADFNGQFAAWRTEVPGYPLSPEGQLNWWADFTRYAARHPRIAGVFYWSPEWYGEGMWKAFALFEVNGEAKPAWRAFRLPTD